MNSDLIPFTNIELAFIGVYLCSLIVIGWLGLRARRENSLRDFYLAGNGIGFVVLLLTLYATQYSGNTLFGFSGKTYRVGYAWIVSVHFMTAIVVFYLLLAPQLYPLAKKHGFITPTDFLRHRFESPALSSLGTVVMVVAISNFLLAQLMAMGNALEGLVGAEPTMTYNVGVIMLALIIVIYETLGGFRAVAWTDAIQGFVLFVGFFILIAMVFREFGSLEQATQILMQREQLEGTASKLTAAGPSKTLAPTGNGLREWISYIVLVGIGGAMYPQAIQRIYASRTATSLRRSLIVMAFVPLTTALIAVLVGIIGLAHVPDLVHEFIDDTGVVQKIDRSDTILTVVCRHIQESSLFGRWLVVVLFAGILAAIMSTADSVLLSISSMVTKDIYGQHLRPQATETEMTRVGKACSWVLIAVLASLAIALRGTDLVKLLDRKFDLLIQLSPAFFLGLHWPRLRATPALVGTIVGLAIALTLAAVDWGKVAGVHAGLYGLAVNVAIAVAGSTVFSDCARRTSRRAFVRSVGT
ncbi:MAG: sodium:solute symporter family protein [Pirellulaceae bacterium]|nr:sodium:solute symporter family protein [Pirellulaceae bacterium]HJN08584.1 sodium:solute symporter family protein [Pirellulaceae bacterium]